MKQRLQCAARRISWPMLLALLASGCLALSLFRLYANNFGTLLFTMAVGPLACAAAGLILFHTALPRHPEFRLLLGLLAVLFVSSALNERFYGAFVENQNDLFTLIALIFVCYALCAALPKEKRTRVLDWLIDGSSAVVGAVALVGVVLAACGMYVLPAFMPEYGVGISPANVAMGADGRLVLFTHPNSAGMICEVVLLLNLYRILTDWRPTVRWLHGACALVCYLAIALAASRTATIAMAVGLALFAFRFVFLRFAHRKAPLRWFAALAAACGALAAAYLLNAAVCGLLLSVSPVNALSDAAVTAAGRNILEDFGMFTGRTTLWNGALQAMRDTPRLFAIGTSPVRVGAVVSSYTPIYAQELHNSFMQMLVSGGVLCLLLFLVFLALLCVRSVRLYFAGEVPASAGTDGPTAHLGATAPLRAGYLPIPLAAILINACMETFLLVYPQLVFASVWFFILAGYAVCLSSEPACIEAPQ